MADGLTTTTTVATIPSATKIATDDAGAAGHVQMVKLAIATDGSATAFPGDATDGLLVNLGANNDVTVTGTVTEASGAAIAASLSVVDDWDESDRAKVNPIVGQAGVQGASGTATALTQRVVLATDIALPAGTNAIGKLAANSGVDIGDIDVTSVIPGTGATNLGKAEDAVHASGDSGVLALVVRQDSAVDLAADGDYIPMTVDADGGLRVSIVAGAGSGGTASADDADFTAGTTSGTPAMGVYESTPTNVTDGDLGTVGITTGRRLKTSATIDAALPAGTNAIGKLAANSGVDIGDVDVTSIAAGDNNIGNVDIVTVPAPLSTTGGGTEATALRVTVATDSTGVLSVDDNGGSLTVDGTVAVSSKTVYTRLAYGTAQQVFNLTTDILTLVFSGAGTEFTNNDATIGAAPFADAMIEIPDWGAAPAAGSVVQLWGLLTNVDSTDDDTDAPASAASGGARLMGSWVMAARDDGTVTRRTIVISLAGIASGFTPYLFNGTAQTMNNDAGTGCVVKITPWTYAMVG